MTENIEPSGRPPVRRNGNLFRKLRWIALLLAMLASAATLVNHGHDIWNWLDPKLAVQALESQNE